MTLNEPDDGDKDGICQVIVGLMQKDRRKARAKGEDNFAIGYMMYKVYTYEYGQQFEMLYNCAEGIETKV